MPGDQDRVGHRPARPEPAGHHDRTAVAAGRLRVVRGLVGPKGPLGNLPPENRHRVKPATPEPLGLDQRPVADHAQAGAAEGFAVGRVEVVEEDPAAGQNPAAAVAGSRLPAGRQVAEMVGELEGDRPVGTVDQAVLQDSAGEAGAAVVQGYEGTPAGQFHRQRQAGIRKAEAGDREFAPEPARLEPGQALVAALAQAAPLEPLVVNALRGKQSLDQPGYRPPARQVEQGKTGIGGRQPVGQGREGRLVMDRKILEGAAGVEADAAGADAAQRKSHLRGPGAGEGAPAAAGQPFRWVRTTVFMHHRLRQN
ncbi:MAG: hypothetical protein BWY73_01644 [candidate division TA06 bacterium ADurb.Bin417]|uniref:Uncharacterized protein n=1 Tax=candidate division TA06 bacterium ADurb.Bin417 TaxID=1852828 RepID=A0A1V5M5T1_UNCT6|nr:MAG: hypothetical protein BWY73_01644 [candidate division TA06 bacterium ADurb.Bin417]